MMLALLVAGALAAPFPLELGSTWVYRETYTERVFGLDASSDDLTHFELRGSRLRPFLLQTGGADPASAPVEWGDDFLRVGSFTGEDALPLPLEVGRRAPPGDGDRPGYEVEALEPIDVPAGHFEALRCALRTPQSESVLWIAPGVGVVRETQGSPGRKPEIERVLVRYRIPGQPATH